VSAEEPLPWEQLRNTGMLWLINRVVFHPRGYALAVHIDPDGVHGWSMLGDGTEVWAFDIESDDECFAKAEAFLTSLTYTRPPTEDER